MRPADARVLHQLTPARRQLLWVVGTGVIAAVLVIAQAWTVAALVLAVLRGEDLLGPGLLLGGVLLLRGIAGWAGDVSAARAAGTVGTALRRRIIAAAVDRRPDLSAGAVSVLATRGVSAAQPYLTRYLPALVLGTLLPPLTVLVMATQDLLSAVIVLCTLPLVPIFGALVGLATRDRAEAQWREMSALSGHFLDVVRGLPTLVAHRRAKAQSSRLAAMTNRYRIASLKTLRLAFASSLVLELVATLSVALVAVTAGVRLAQGSLDLPTALVVLLLAPEAYWPLRRMAAEFHAAAEGVATFEAVHRLVDEDSPTAGSPAVPDAALVLDDVTVVHAGRAHPAVDGLDAVIPARGVTALTGPSGCGKSTLLDALAGLVPLTSGTVTAAGLPVGGPGWQSLVAWLPQRPHFVAGSLADNLRLGAPCATDDELWTALRKVALEERVRSLPDRLDSPLGEDGADLSAGERARLAMARIVLADRPWVLLDEPTAHLDLLTEQIVADTIAELGRHGAVVVVTHRRAIIALADHVIELPTPSAPAPRPASAAPEPTARRVHPDEVGPLPTRGFALSTALGTLASLSGVALTATAGWLIVQASTQPAVLTMLVAIVGVRTFGLARPVLRYAERLVSHDAALGLLARRRVQVYDAVVPLTPARLGRRRGDLLASIVDDVDSVVDRELRVRLPVRSGALVVLLASLVAATLLPTAGVLVATTSALAGLGAWLLARTGPARAERDSVTTRAELSEAVVETVQVAAELRMWQAGGAASDRIAALSDRLGRSGVQCAAWTGAARAWVLAVTGSAMVLMALVTTPALAEGSLSGPLMALLVLIPLALADVLLPVADPGALSVQTGAAAERLATLEHTAPAVRDTVATQNPRDGVVRVDRVRAAWDATAPMTAECSVVLAPGDRVALVGRSGSGKSTVAALMLRFLDPGAGQITRGGAALSNLRLDDVRRATGLVDDDPHVFATNVVENVRLARPGASDAEVASALRSAHLGAWLDTLPEGLQTWLGDGHSGISGGERARLGVARSLLADQPVLVLDEPAAHLDHATATALAHELLTGPRQRTVLWITHTDVGLDLVDSCVSLDPDVRPVGAGGQ